MRNFFVCLNTLGMLRRLLFEFGFLFENSILNVLDFLVFFNTKD